MLGPTVVLSALIVTSGLTLFYMIHTRHIERMTRIEHGLDEPDPHAFKNTLKNMGVFLISLAAGLLASYVFSKLFGLPDYVLIPGCLLLFGGSSLIYIGKS